MFGLSYALMGINFCHIDLWIPPLQRYSFPVFAETSIVKELPLSFFLFKYKISFFILKEASKPVFT